MKRKNQRQKGTGGLNQNRCGQATQGQNRNNQNSANGQGVRGRCRR